MNANAYPIPVVTKNISIIVQPEFKVGTRHAYKTVIDRIKPDLNPNIAVVIEKLAKRSHSPFSVLYCGAIVYRFIEKAYELAGQDVPRVTEDTCKNVLVDAPEIEEEKVYRMIIAKRLRKHHPFMLDVIANFSTYSADKEFVIYVGLIVYALIERQLMSDLEQIKKEAIDNNDLVRVDILQKQIEALRDDC